MVFCGIDIGTTSTKAVVLGRDGQVLDEVTFPAPAGTGETYWYQHFCRTMDLFGAKGRFAGEPIACSVTGQGGSFVLLDDGYRPVGSACSWTALAEDAVVGSLIGTLGVTACYRLAGWPPHGWLAACKLKQMIENRQLPYEARYVATVPDSIYAQLTGELSIDITSAQITGLADFRKSQWSRDMVRWVGVRKDWLPPIVAELRIVAEGVRTGWGRMTLVTGSHDQYAAMEAAGLEKDKSVMLGTGTAWVLNGRTGRPLYDEDRFLVHPGRDLHPDCYGFIVTLWQIGAGFDKLLANLGVTPASLGQLEDTLAGEDVPHKHLTVDLDAGLVRPAGHARLAVRRYMEWAGAEVLRALEDCGLAPGLDKIVVAGGAMKSRFWPQAIADICGLTVEAVDYPYFTAYGAALHAWSALQGSAPGPRFPPTAVVRTYSPRQAEAYRAWYEHHQKPSRPGPGGRAGT
jgi:sugar (pentulose or hexulose) kinase